MENTQIKAVFACGKRTVITQALYMYDVGVELGIFGVDLPEYFTAYFANSEDGTATKMLGHDGYVEIPNILLTTGLPVYCWVYVSESETEARAMYMARIPVRQRARDDAEITPAQQEAIDMAIAALNASNETVAGMTTQISEVVSTITNSRVTSLDNTVFEQGNGIDVAGIPTFVEDVEQYVAYGLTEPGWYIFARIKAPNGVTVTRWTVISSEVVSSGSYVFVAAYEAGDDHIDIAVKFDVAAVSRKVTIGWNPYMPGMSETFVFRASDLAVRNLDYRTTFYVYDIDEFASWEYGQTEDTAISEGKTYYVMSGSEYIAADVTAGTPITIYYTRSYRLTEDETFQAGTTYYVKNGVRFVEDPSVVVGATIPAGAYYVVDRYYQCSGALAEGNTYYIKSGDTYTVAEIDWQQGAPVSMLLYEHKKLTFEGMTRNVTYRFNQTVDCPIEFILPEIPDDGYGAWFEVQMQYNGTYSCELVMPSDDIKAGTAQTQKQSKGINVMDLHYTNVNGRKTWTLINTHSNLPTEGGT